MGYKQRCKICKEILTGDQYRRGFIYCRNCFNTRQNKKCAYAPCTKTLTLQKQEHYIYCSTQCSNKGSSQVPSRPQNPRQNFPSYMYMAPPPLMKVIGPQCSICHETLQQKQLRKKWTQCSYPCFMTAQQKKHEPPEQKNNNKKQNSNLLCSVCFTKLNFSQLRKNKKQCSNQCAMIAQYRNIARQNSKFQSNKTLYCQKCSRELQDWQIKKNSKFCSKCYSKEFFFRNHIGRVSNDSITQKMVNQIKKQIVLSSIEQGWIQIPNAEILRQTLSEALSQSLFGDEQIPYEIQKLMIVFRSDKQVINRYLRQYQEYPNIQVKFDQFDYCYSAFKGHEKDIIKRDLKSILQEERINHDFRKNVDYIDIQDIAMILLSNSQDQYNRCIKIDFTKEYVQTFVQYHQEFVDQRKKKKKVPENKELYFQDHFAIGISLQQQDKYPKAYAKKYNFFRTLERKNTCIMVQKQPKKAVIYISLNYQFTIKTTIDIDEKSISSIKYDSKKNDYYFFLNRSPQFEARYCPDSVSYSIRSVTGNWLTIDNLILEHGNLDYFQGKDYEKLKFSKEISFYLHVQNEEKDIYKFGGSVQEMSISTAFFSIKQLPSQWILKQNYVNKINLMKEYLNKDTVKTHQQKINYWTMLHYIELDTLLAIQLNNTQHLRILFQEKSQVLNQKYLSFQVIQQLFELIHTEKIYLSTRKRKQEEYRVMKRKKKVQKAQKIMKIIPIYNVAFTPTGIKYRGYTNQFQSRILRQFPNQLFIKGTFCNEDGSKIISNSKNDSTYLIQNSFKQYINGFTLQGVRYLPLGWSNSQIKNIQLWFINSDHKFYKEGRSIRQDIYNFLGDFSKIPNPAKKASRIGQSFSASVRFLQAQNINKPILIPDIKTEIQKKDNSYIQYVYSDGIGMISQNLLEKIRQQLKLKKDVCAVQCRYLGIKGVVSLGIKSNTSQNNIYVPKSMIKYECLWNDQTKKHFDVLNWNKYCPGFINVEIILLLLGLGVKLDLILKNVKEILQEELYAHNINNQTIINYYKTHLDHSPTNQDSLFQLIDFLNNCDQEKHLKNLLKTQKFFSEIIDKVKRQISIKAYKKIRVRVKKSARLMGILDTYGVLLQDEVYCTIHKKQGMQIQNIAECGFITKNPCLHPADIRRVKCVSDQIVSQRLIAAGFDKDEFKKYINVIVFNQKGKYPLAAQISGGDLDGDYYFLCWDQNLLPPVIQAPHLYDSGIIEDKQAIKQYESAHKSPIQSQEKTVVDKAVLQSKENQSKQNQSQKSQNPAQITQTSIETAQIVDFKPQNQVMNEKLLNFFIFYMSKNMLGLVTRYHILFAQSKMHGGVRGAKCKQIAKLHAIQLDFGKKGKEDKPFPIQLTPPQDWKLYRQKHWTQRKTTPLGQIFHQIVQMHKNNAKNAVKKEIKSINWSTQYQKFQFSQEEIEQALEILSNYKRDVQIILFNHNKINSSEFIIYHGRDEDYITDSIMLRQQYRDLFFDDEDDKQFYQSTNIEQFLKGQLKFKENVYKKAYLWYLVSMSPFFMKQVQPYNTLFNKQYKIIIFRSSSLVDKNSKDFRTNMKVACYFQFKKEDDEEQNQLQTKDQSANLPYHPKNKMRERTRIVQERLFQNVFGLTWHVIPKLIISMVNQAEGKQ